MPGPDTATHAFVQHDGLMSRQPSMFCVYKCARFRYSAAGMGLRHAVHLNTWHARVTSLLVLLHQQLLAHMTLQIQGMGRHSAAGTRRDSGAAVTSWH